MRPGVLGRPRLLARLRFRPGVKVAMLVAPAGFGKTTLARQAIGDEGRVGWLSNGLTGIQTGQRPDRHGWMRVV